MEEKKENAVALKNSVGDDVIARVNEMCQVGMTFPKDYNFVNSVKMAMLRLKDVNGKDVTDPAVCDPKSLQTALLDMVVKGLNVALNQCYPILYGNKLRMDAGYFGNSLRVQRIFPNWEPEPHSVRQGDVFEVGTNPKNGRKYLIKHEQTMESMDADFVGGYIYLPTKDGEGKLYIMTKKQILAAWSKSKTSRENHKLFDEKMIGKTLVNSGCTMIINSTPELQVPFAVDEEEHNDKQIEPAYAEFEEVPATEAVDLQAEIPKPEPKKQGRPAKEVADKPKEEVKAEATVAKEDDGEPF